MKLLLSLSLLSLLASCASNPRPTSEMVCVGAPAANKGLGYVSYGVDTGVTTTVNAVDDTTDMLGIIVDRQARDYTNIVTRSVGQADDIVVREAHRGTDYAMDTVDDGAKLTARAIRRYPAVGTKVYRRATGSARRVVQSTAYAYGDVVDTGLWSTLNIVKPLDPKPWMVGSLNDLHAGYALPGSSWKCKLQPIEVVEEEVTSEKNPRTVYK